MKAYLSGFLTVILLAFYQTHAQTIQEGFWIKVFTLDVLAPGASLSLPARNKMDCAGRCLQQPDCKTFAFQERNATCWLYRHLVEYTTTGMASPGTGYFWRLSPSCPGELGYQLEAGICLKVYNWRVNWTTAVETCRNDGGHLLIADTVEKRNAVIQKTYGSVWLGASDKDKEGEWRWVDGTLMKVANWGLGEPNNFYGNEQFLKLQTDGYFIDVLASDINSAACQIPLLY